MWAAGSHEISRAPGDSGMISCSVRAAGHDVAVGELDALGWTGRPRGVDQGEDDRRARPRPARRPTSKSTSEAPSTLAESAPAVPVRGRRRRPRSRARARAAPRGPPASTPGTPARRSPPGSRIGAQVADLLGRIGEIDRERRRPEHRRRQVDDVELGAVAEHDRHGVAPSDPELPARRPPPRPARAARDQVSETPSSTVRTATISGCAAAVRRSASVSVGASTAAAPRA